MNKLQIFCLSRLQNQILVVGERDCLSCREELSFLCLDTVTQTYSLPKHYSNSLQSSFMILVKPLLKNTIFAFTSAKFIKMSTTVSRFCDFKQKIHFQPISIMITPRAFLIETFSLSFVANIQAWFQAAFISLQFNHSITVLLSKIHHLQTVRRHFRPIQIDTFGSKNRRTGYAPLCFRQYSASSQQSTQFIVVISSKFSISSRLFLFLSTIVAWYGLMAFWSVSLAEKPSKAMVHASLMIQDGSESQLSIFYNKVIVIWLIFILPLISACLLQQAVSKLQHLLMIQMLIDMRSSYSTQLALRRLTTSERFPKHSNILQTSIDDSISEVVVKTNSITHSI